MDEPMNEPRLKHFPVPLFAVVMGLMGLSLALQASATAFPVLGFLASLAMWFGIAAFVTIALFYIAKCLKFSDAVQAEWNHPVKLAFFPAISISMLLMASALLVSFPQTAKGIWIIGALLQGVLTIAVISGWISHRSFEVGQLTPAWFIPAVGNVIAPIAGAKLGFIELSWLFFSAGLVFWMILLTLVFNRLIFHNPIPAKLFPTLVILIAPPAVAFVAYLSLTGTVDTFARILLNSGYVFAILVAVQIPKFKGLPFALSWWALSFPVAGLTIASFQFATATGSWAHIVIGTSILVVLLIIMTGLIWRTALAFARDEICLPD